MWVRPHGGVREAVVDFSVNTNPLGPPPWLREVIEECVRRGGVTEYPDQNYSRLKAAIAEYYGISNSWIIPTAGAAEALSLLIAGLRPVRVVTESPTYGEKDVKTHCYAVGCVVLHHLMRVEGDRFVQDPAEAAAVALGDKVLVIFSSPNNPTGSYVGLEEVSEAFRGRRMLALYDVAYSELGPGFPDLGDMPPSVVVVHSFTKALNIPGLRAGFMVLRCPEVARRVDAARQPWNVPNITACVITKLLTEYGDELRAWVRASREYVRAERERLSSRLRRAGYVVYESTANFVLIRHDWISSRELARKALDAGIGLRPAHTFAGLDEHYTRVSIRLPEENEFLVRFLEGAAPN